MDLPMNAKVLLDKKDLPHTSHSLGRMIISMNL